MNEFSDEILLVVPVWNDSARLAGFGGGLAREIAASGLPVRWIIADDGSEPGEEARLRELCAGFAGIYPRVELHLVRRHLGKGAVVRDAWKLDPAAGWLAFVDADGSTSAGDFLGLIRRAVDSGVSVLGVRKRTATTRVEESFIRALPHRGFLLAVRWLLGLHAADPQCGAKVFKAADFRRIEPRLSEDGLAFDSEMLAALQYDGAMWQEVPVSWIEKKGGRIRLFRDAWRMFAALFRIRAARKRGQAV
jgi:hypothetical protein